MTESPRVSVVIPSYNHGSFVEAAARSVLDSWDDLELVVVDDGSTDDSRERLQAMGDGRLRLFLQENQGAHAALSRGIDQSRGEFVFILNSDDVFHPRRIERVLEVFVGHPSAALVCSWLEIIDASDAPLGVKKAWQNLPPWPPPQPGPGLAETGDPLLAMLTQNFVSTTSNVAFRRQRWLERELHFAPLRYTHDWDFILACCDAPGDLRVIDDPLVRYRVHGQNTIAEGRDEGEERMHFEILWTLARHAHRILTAYSQQGFDFADLRQRLWRSVPDFGQTGLFAQLLTLRGQSEEVPASYDRLLHWQRTARGWQDLQESAPNRHPSATIPG